MYRGVSPLTLPLIWHRYDFIISSFHPGAYTDSVCVYIYLSIYLYMRQLSPVQKQNKRDNMLTLQVMGIYMTMLGSKKEKKVQKPQET